MIWIFLFLLFLVWLRHFSPIIVTYKLLSSNAHVPTRSYHKAACYDMYGTEDVTIPPGQWRKISTDIAFAPWPHIYIKKLNLTFTPFGNVASKIHTRSGLASKKGQRAHLGIIDNDWRGECGVIMFNHNSYPVRYHPGDRIAQIEFYRVPQVWFWKREKKLSNSLRGTGGFGSSGK